MDENEYLSRAWAREEFTLLGSNFNLKNLSRKSKGVT